MCETLSARPARLHVHAATLLRESDAVQTTSLRLWRSGPRGRASYHTSMWSVYGGLSVAAPQDPRRASTRRRTTTPCACSVLGPILCPKPPHIHVEHLRKSVHSGKIGPPTCAARRRTTTPGACSVQGHAFAEQAHAHVVSLRESTRSDKSETHGVNPHTAEQRPHQKAVYRDLP